MRLRRLLVLALVGAAVVALLRRMKQTPQARVDVYLGDGTLTSLGEDAPEGAFLLSLAREVRASI
jgi:hypothetical protein